ncbi:MAG: hypothetical protein K6G33_05755 [Ruminococcus sp.]|uniref:hypothetical protein n=1 Tax=Ruminococcus sp. TaxID=41978 RepID=UPI0025FEEAB6|nr:hypothetical protein [Ruminococcus sp.]MCR5600228.1 hypothetical protein [Ruminococcus sp.]
MNAENNIFVGGWIVTQGDMSIDKHPDALAAFNKAIEGIVGAKYEPLALLATQLVAGKNYCILCKVTLATLEPVVTLKKVIVYADLDGNATITKISDVLGGAPISCIPANSDAVLGGWEVVKGDTSIEVHPDALAALEKAVTGLMGAKYEPTDLVATQIVSGNNYCILCRITPVTLDPKPKFAFVYVYEDTEKNASVTGIDEIIGAPMPGGFIANEGDTKLDKNPKVKEAFDAAIKDSLGVQFDSVAYLGSQVVAGINYLVLCKTTVVYPGAEPKLTFVTINVDLEQNAKLLKTEPYTPGK